MNLATPIIIAHQNEDFRSLLRDMLTRHGFFHILETSTAEEWQAIEKKDHFLLVESTFVQLDLKGKFLILTRGQERIDLVVRYGVEKFLSFPFSSQRLIEKLAMA